MDFLFYIFQMVIAFLFLTTAWDKLMHWKEHVQRMVAYQIVNSSLSKILLFIFLISEWYISCSLIISGPNLSNILICLSILTIYSTAISINLIRGNYHISCGCGGVLESNELHIGLVIRNILMMLIIGSLLFTTNNSIELTISLKLIGSFVSISILLLYGIILETNKLNRALQRLSKFIF